MNRLEMHIEIAKRVPILVQANKDKWKAFEELRKRFFSDYPIGKIPTLKLDEYVIGKGGDNPSFCYRLERETDALGRILGSPAFRFGIYYGRTKSATSVQYRFASRWGKSVNEATVDKNPVSRTAGRRFEDFC